MEGSIVDSWTFLGDSNSSDSKERSALDLKLKVKNYKTIIRVLIHDHG